MDSTIINYDVYVEEPTQSQHEKRVEELKEQRANSKGEFHYWTDEGIEKLVTAEETGIPMERK